MNPNLKLNLEAWIGAARPKTLTASVGPVLLGLAGAWSTGPFQGPQWGFALVILLCTLLMQVGANLVNDYHDHKSGVDRAVRIGPQRAVASGLIPAQQVRRAYQLCFISGFLLGLILIARGGWPILAVGLCSLLFAYAYTGGPYPLSHAGLGEVLALIFFGPVAVEGTYYLETLHFSWNVLFCGLGPGLIAATIMAINNLRDHESDQGARKRTLAVVMGQRGGRLLCLCLVVTAALIPLLQFLTGALTQTKIHPVLLVAALSPLPFLKVWKGILKEKVGPVFNFYLAQTGKFLLLYSISFSLGLLI